MSSRRMDKEHLIPVVFDLTTENPVRELDAARALSELLSRKHLPETWFGSAVGQEFLLESWHMQNHPAADRSDHEGALIFFPVHRPPRSERLGGNDEPSDQMQRAIDAFLETTGRWLRDG